MTLSTADLVSLIGLLIAITIVVFIIRKVVRLADEGKDVGLVLSGFIQKQFSFLIMTMLLLFFIGEAVLVSTFHLELGNNHYFDQASKIPLASRFLGHFMIAIASFFIGLVAPKTFVTTLEMLPNPFKRTSDPMKAAKLKAMREKKGITGTRTIVMLVLSSIMVILSLGFPLVNIHMLATAAHQVPQFELLIRDIIGNVDYSQVSVNFLTDVTLIDKEAMSTLPKDYSPFNDMVYVLQLSHYMYFIHMSLVVLEGLLILVWAPDVAKLVSIPGAKPTGSKGTNVDLKNKPEEALKKIFNFYGGGKMRKMDKKIKDAVKKLAEMAADDPTHLTRMNTKFKAIIREIEKLESSNKVGMNDKEAKQVRLDIYHTFRGATSTGEGLGMNLSKVVGNIKDEVDDEDEED